MDADKLVYCFYRYHVPDPIYFRQDVRVAIQQIGCWTPESRSVLATQAEPIRLAAPGAPPVDWSMDARDHGLFERRDDWSSCAYFYLDRPDNELPPLAPVAERIADLEH